MSASGPPSTFTIFPCFTVQRTGSRKRPKRRLGMLPSKTISPSAVPSTGEMLASIFGKAENLPGRSRMQSCAFPERPRRSKVQSVPPGGGGGAVAAGGRVADGVADREQGNIGRQEGGGDDGRRLVAIHGPGRHQCGHHLGG